LQVNIFIQNSPDAVFAPVITDSVTWETKRSGSPGKLTFSVISDDILKAEEGNAVRLDVDGAPVFFGYLFERSWGKDGIIKAVAYDQLRYLKNKDSYNYTDKNASDVIRMIAADFNLQLGEIVETSFHIPFRNKKDNALFDIILDALELTMIHDKKIYVLYDDVGKLTLKDTETMKVGILIDQETAEDYSYKASIDGDTYNQIKVYYDNDETKKREIFMAKHTENINKWGILQKYESIDKGANGQEIAESYLTVYNKPARSMSIKNAFGDVRVRAGCVLPISLNVGDIMIYNNLLVEQVKHTFKEGVHWMDLTLKGANIFG